MSNQQIAALLGVVGVVGGLAAQARSNMCWFSEKLELKKVELLPLQDTIFHTH